MSEEGGGGGQPVNPYLGKYQQVNLVEFSITQSICSKYKGVPNLKIFLNTEDGPDPDLDPSQE